VEGRVRVWAIGIRTRAVSALQSLQKYRKESAFKTAAAGCRDRKTLCHSGLRRFRRCQKDQNNRRRFPRYQETICDYQETDRACFLFFNAFGGAEMSRRCVKKVACNIGLRANEGARCF